MVRPTGTPDDVLNNGELAIPEPATGEVRVRLRYSGINPGDIKKRRGWLGSTMPYPRVVPHSDGAGVVDAVGDGVERARIGHRVWVHGAQSYRPIGTAAEYTVVPSGLAIDRKLGFGPPSLIAAEESMSDWFAVCLALLVVANEVRVDHVRPMSR